MMQLMGVTGNARKRVKGWHHCVEVGGPLLGRCSADCGADLLTCPRKYQPDETKIG